jgi:hypothetical protein
VVKLFASRVRQARVVAVYFTHGDRREVINPREIRLGKLHLVSNLQTLLQTDCLHLPRTPDADVLAAELRDFQIQVAEDANDRYGNFPVGSRDELVTALGLASQEEPRQLQVFETSRSGSPTAFPSGRRSRRWSTGSPGDLNRERVRGESVVVVFFRRGWSR